MQADFHADSVLTRSFSQEMSDAGACLKAGGFDPGQQDLIKRLAKALADDGPHPAYAGAFDDWRKRKHYHYKRNFLLRWQPHLAHGVDGVLIATGEKKSGKTAEFSSTMRKKIAALCFAQHFFLEERYGDHHIWVLDLPDAYKNWPSIQIAKSNPVQLDFLIQLKAGKLEEKHREQLGQAVTHAAAYTEKAHAMLSQAQPGNRAWEVVKRWFADEETSDAMLQKFIGVMMSGLRKFINVLRSNKIVLLDHPQLRSEIHSKSDQEFFKAEAFVFKNHDPVTAIYIQQALYKENPIVKGPRNFARLLIHEIAHREMRTADHKSAIDGIKPTKIRLPFSDTSTNSDSWAYCVMDLADMLTPLEIARARIN